MRWLLIFWLNVESVTVTQEVVGSGCQLHLFKEVDREACFRCCCFFLLFLFSFFFFFYLLFAEISPKDSRMLG